MERVDLEKLIVSIVIEDRNLAEPKPCSKLISDALKQQGLEIVGNKIMKIKKQHTLNHNYSDFYYD